MPPNTLYVGRPSKWQNPCKIKDGLIWMFCRKNRRYVCTEMEGTTGRLLKYYRQYLTAELNNKRLNLEEIRGYDHLACWCSLDNKCHADVLIELINK